MGKDFLVTVHEPDRAAEFKQVFGTDTVAVRSFIPTVCLIEGVETECYLLDLDLLTDEQYSALVHHISQKFNASREMVAAQLNQHGLPIIASDCIVEVRNPGKWID